MSDDRRASVRRQAVLPFSWRPIDADATLADVCRALDLPHSLILQSRMAELDEELRRLTAVLDTRTADALRVLDTRLSLLEEALLAAAPRPAPRPVTVSADGIGFEESAAVDIGSRIGMHLVLPVSQHLVVRGRVSHCRPTQPGYRVGVELLDLEPTVARRLTRFAIGRERDDSGYEDG